RGEARGDLLDPGAGDAAPRARAEVAVELEGLDRVVRADAVAGGLGAEAGRVGGLVGKEAAAEVDGLGQLVVQRFWDDEVRVGHGGPRTCGLSGSALFSGKLARDWQVQSLT